MTISSLPLSYCTNVHPARTVAEVLEGLATYTVPIQQRVGETIAAGLWLPRSTATEILAQPNGAQRFAEQVAGLGLQCYTLNAFPYGDFHSPRVKEQVYLPNWTTAFRYEYTRDCAELLAAFLPEGGEGSISTVPLAFKGFSQPLDFADRCCTHLLQLARDLEALWQRTGRRIRLAIEPEPYCVLETTAETLAFFEILQQAADRAGIRELADTYLGVCYDVCHQAVEFEDVSASIRSLVAAGIRINKVHITCALECRNPRDNAAGREFLSQYIEPRYLHQTMCERITPAKKPGEADKREILRSVDLSTQLTDRGPADYQEAQTWRIHFHVPVDAEELGPLHTTRTQLREALACLPELAYAPHLEVETYTWGVMPQGATAPAGPERLIAGLARELTATRRLLT